MDIEKGFLNSDVSKITGLTKRQIVHWTEKHLVLPLVKDTRGAGYKRKYAYINLLEFGLANELFNLGFTPYHIKQVLDCLRDDDTIKKWENAIEKIKADIHFLEQSSIPFIKVSDEIRKEFIKDLKKMLLSGDPIGVLLYCTIESKAVLNLQLYTMDYFYKNSGNLISDEEYKKSKSVIIINLGQIKQEIDNKIKEEGLQKEGY